MMNLIVEESQVSFKCRASNTYFQRLRSRIKIKYPFVRHVSESVLYMI